MASPHPDEREVYRFTATDTEGNRREGTVLATDPGDVAHQLPTGWTLRECRLLELVEQPLPAWAGGDAPPVSTTPALTLTDSLTESDAGEMATHLAALAQSGIPLEGGLRALAEELPEGRVKRAVQRLAAELEAGTDLESALGSSGVPESLRVVVRAGLQRGDLGATLARHAAISQTLAQSRLLVWSALAGPLVASVLSMVLLFLLLGWLVPRFAELYEGFGLQLSGLTRVVLALGRWLNRQAPWLLLVGLGGLVAVGLLGRLAGRRALLATCLGWVPLVGSLLRTLGLVRLCDMLSLLVESHVPLPEALRLAGQASGDQVLTQESERLAATLTAGGEVTQKPREWQKLPAGLVELIANAGSQETLVALLQAQACLQVQRARGIAQLVALLVPWLLMPVVGLAVLLVLVGLFLPLVQLLRALV